MNVGLIILLSFVAWRLGPAMLRYAGAVLLLLVLLAWAIPTAPHTGTGTLASLALVGALMRYTGTMWQAWRESPGRYQRGHRLRPRHPAKQRTMLGDDWRETSAPDQPKSGGATDRRRRHDR